MATNNDILNTDATGQHHVGVKEFHSDDANERLKTVFRELSNIPLIAATEQEAFQQITELGKATLGSHTFTLIFVNSDAPFITIEASSSNNPAFESYMKYIISAGVKIKMGSVPDDGALDYDLFSGGAIIEKYHLSLKGQGVVLTEVAGKYGLESLLAYPLRQNQNLVGYICHFSDVSREFTDEQKQLMEIFAHNTMVSIELFEKHQLVKRVSKSTNAIFQSLLYSTLEEHLRHVIREVRDLLDVSTCVIWRPDSNKDTLRIVEATEDVDDAFREIQLDLESLKKRAHIRNHKVKYIDNISNLSDDYLHGAEARKRGWVSFLSAPMWINGRLEGLIDVYTTKPRRFKPWELDQFQAFTYDATNSIFKAEQQNRLAHADKIQQLPAIMQEMTETRDIDILLEICLRRSLELLECENGWISRQDYHTGELIFVAVEGDRPPGARVRLGEGVTGLALANEKPIRVDDVRSPEWASIYINIVPESRSELAVPIIIPDAEARIGRDIETRSKKIGVINLESPFTEAFTQTDQELLTVLANHAAVRIERLEGVNRSLRRDEMKKQMVGIRDWDEILLTAGQTIKSSSQFDYVNISIVDEQRKRIQTKVVLGFSPADEAHFLKYADHLLTGEDIQADIVRHRCIEVPEQSDPRFDKNIHDPLNMSRFLRVFIPMIDPSDKRVIGTVEVGYLRNDVREYFYDREILTLKGFVDYIALFLQRGNKGLLERMSHEFRSALTGIKSNADFLRKRHKQLAAETIKRKCEDILLDSDLLLFQLNALELVIGAPTRPAKIEKTLVFREVIIKTIKQLQLLLDEHGFNESKINYKSSDIYRIPPIFVDKTKLNEVVYNILINAVKYNEESGRPFVMGIAVDQEQRNYLIRFSDWGIGIEEEYTEQIFHPGFRTPEAISKNVFGSGLGLAISRKIMREIGGDLRLKHRHKPTEFEMVIPKKLRKGAK